MCFSRLFDHGKAIRSFSSSCVGGRREWLSIIFLVALLIFPYGVEAHEGNRVAQSPPQINLEVHGTRVSGVIHQAPLQQILEHLGHLLPLSLERSPDSPNPLVSLTFHETPIGEALDRLLLGQNYALSQLPNTDHSLTSDQPIRVTLLPHNVPPSSSPNPTPLSRDPFGSQSVEELQKQASYGTTSAVRIAALGKLYGKIPTAEMQSILLEALHDEDPQVRTLTISMLGNSKEKESEVVEALKEAARWDDSPTIRMEALKSLAKKDPQEASEILQRAINEDLEDSVRNAAQLLLDGLPKASQ